MYLQLARTHLESVLILYHHLPICRILMPACGPKRSLSTPFFASSSFNSFLDVQPFGESFRSVKAKDRARARVGV